MYIIKICFIINIIVTFFNLLYLFFNLLYLFFIIINTFDNKTKTKTTYVKDVWECPICHQITFNGENHYCTFCKRKMKKVK